MENSNNPREHHNLYYIFEADKNAHPLPLEMADEIRRKILEKFFKKDKTFKEFNSPLLTSRDK